MSDLEEWMKLAPPPADRPADKRWHVFLSYRSVERPWVLSLYDTLTQLGYAVFLDQFVLDTSSRLTRSLEENLEGSQTGILIWSPKSEDSEWCKQEYDTFVTKEKESGFRFVIARLGNAELPTFARSKIWVDYTESREGPRGSGLLRLLYGLQGKALPDGAVRLAVAIDEETRISLARIRAARENQDKERLLELGKSSQLAWRASPLLRCACAEALVSMKASEAAIDLLEAVLREFPKSLRPRQLSGLALARAGRWREAKTALGELYELGERDPETVGLYARTWMDSFEATRNELHLRRSRDLYVEAFLAAPGNYYVGINAAAKSIFLHEMDVGRAHAERVQAIVGTAAKHDDYWMTATVAEVQLIQGRFAEAAQLYSAAVAMSPGREGDHESTWRQASRLLSHLSPTEADVAAVAQAFRHLAQQPVTR
jgi:tetratricopeptide (TPR) repeat protein